MRASFAALLVVTGCGRIGFDSLAAGDGGGGEGGEAGMPAPSARIAIADTHACAIDAGRLWCWGANSLGELGIGRFSTEERRPVRVGTDADWLTVSAGKEFSCGIRAGGNLYCWGQNGGGTLGTGPDLGNQETPQLVGSGWSSVASKDTQSCGLRMDATVWCWGVNDGGETGVPGPSVDRVPRQIPIGAGWSEVHTGFNYGIALKPGVANFWGSDQEGQRGDGTSGGDDFPPMVLSLGFAPISLAVGNEHNCGIDAQGDLWCWGDNRAGEIGNGLITSSDQPTPVVIAVPGTPTAYAAGGHTTCAIIAGKLFCWGDNASGQLGLGDSGAGTERALATRVGTQTDWTGIAVGRETVCGTRPSGMYCWGNNVSGELGIGSSATLSVTPVGPLVF